MANLKDLLVNGSTNHVGRNYSQTPALGTKDRQVATTEFVLDNCYKPPLLSCMWADHLLNDMSWLRADTFSWQDGTTYSSAYNELLSEYNNSASTTKTEGSITFKRTPKGYKIALADQENAILNKYNSDGIAWYYILDTTNTRFKLPRTKFGFGGLRTNVGDDIEAGLPNITGTWAGAPKTYVSQFGTGAFQNIEVSGSYGYDTGGGQGSGFNFDASRSSLIYGNSDTVQPPATQMYLYFYVGEFARNSVQQTAGLNSELFNGKADVDTPSIQAPYIKDTYENGTSGYRIWSDGYCEQWGKHGAIGQDSTLVITLLKPYKDTNYMIFEMPYFTNNTDNIRAGCGYNNKTTSSFTLLQDTFDDNGGNWFTCGYLAEGEY